MSFEFSFHPKDEASSTFVSRVGRLLQRALERRKQRDRLTQQQLAERLGVDRSRVNRCFSGYNNLTISTLAELAWALNARIRIDIDLCEEDPGCNLPAPGGNPSRAEAIVPHSAPSRSKAPLSRQEITSFPELEAA